MHHARCMAVPALTLRVAVQYDPTSAPALALTATIERTEKRFANYSKQGLLCGNDGLPHLIADPGLALRYGHAGEVLVRARGHSDLRSLRPYRLEALGAEVQTERRCAAVRVCAPYARLRLRALHMAVRGGSLPSGPGQGRRSLMTLITTVLLVDVVARCRQGTQRGKGQGIVQDPCATLWQGAPARCSLSVRFHTGAVQAAPHSHAVACTHARPPRAQIPTIGFLYIAGWIGYVGRQYLIIVKGEKKPFEKEIIIDVPLALRLSLQGAAWPLKAVRELQQGSLVESQENITVRPASALRLLRVARGAA